VDSLHEGVLVVDKEGGPTSHDVVAHLRQLLGMRRIGHCGTLDPLATGILVICLGRYTRLADRLGKGIKEYESVFEFGATSDTDDTEGVVTLAPVPHPPEAGDVEAAMGRFRGEIDQIPPAYSAVRVDGVRSYKRARRQQAVPLKPRRVSIAEFEVQEFRYPRLKVRVVCSQGTYIRSLARDLGSELGCGGHVSSLRRLRVGCLGLGESARLSEIGSHLRDGGDLGDLLVPVRKALAGYPTVSVGPGGSAAFTHGATVPSSDVSDGDAVVCAGNGECTVHDAEGRFLGIGAWREDGKGLRPVTVMCQGGPADDAGPQPRDVDPPRGQVAGLLEFAGVVEAGRARGRSLGFPTANLAVDASILARVPRGVYVGRARWRDDEWGAVVNIGERPTFAEEGVSLEIHLLDFAGDLYGETLAVRIIRLLRPERRFASAEALSGQIEKDIQQARAELSQNRETH